MFILWINLNNFTLLLKFYYFSFEEQKRKFEERFQEICNMAESIKHPFKADNEQEDTRKNVFFVFIAQTWFW